jgi:segregation and condensation protein B
VTPADRISSLNAAIPTKGAMTDVNQPAEELGLDEFSGQPSEDGLSLEDLEQAYLAALEAGDDPYEAPSSATADEGQIAPRQPSGLPAVKPQPTSPHAPPPEDISGASELDAADSPDDDLAPATPVEISPRSILEAMLFVGGKPLSADRLAGLMRGVRSEEVVAHLHDLAEHYRQQGRPYTIVDGPDGHRLVLSSRFSRVAEKLFGTTEREVRLSRAAIDVLAAVAYRQPISRHEIDQLRGANSGAVLRQLVRRELLRISRSHDNPRDVSYHTTDRFLGVFGLASLDELPQSEDLEAP